ncbi:MAG: hypothetical protein K6C98_08225, partial [Treponema sp.]|nr:hypothetical protein [Treponema sp.]
MTIKDFKSQAVKSLVKSPSPALDIEILLCHFLQLDKTHLLLNQNTEIPEEKLT